MTAKQLDLVRELRLYHTPSLFMEAAAEIERLVVKLTVAVADRAAAERKIEQLENRIFALEGKLEQAS